MRKEKRKILAMLLVLMMVMTNFFSMPVTAFAETKDIKGHWAESVIQDWISKGLAGGYPDGTFKPDFQISRAEFFALINKAYNFSSEKSIQFVDAQKNNWYYSTIQKAISAGYVTGYPDGTIKPEQSITRQEAAAIIFKLNGMTKQEQSLTAFKDVQSISEWSKDFVGAVLKAGIMTGYPDHTFKALDPIKRGEAISLLNSALKNSELVYNKAGTYGPLSGVEIIEKSVAIKLDGVTLQNLHIKGNLTISEEVGEGDVTLNNVKVEGNTFVRGGGKNSIHINGGDYNKITIQQTSSGQVRIVAINAAGLEVVVSENAKGEDIILEGAFQNVTVEADQIKLSTQGNTTIKEMNFTVTAKGTKLNLDAKTTVDKMMISAPTDIKGQGIITNAEVKADNVSYEKEPTILVIDPSVKVKPIVSIPVVVIPGGAVVVPDAGGGGGGGLPPTIGVNPVVFVTNPSNPDGVTSPVTVSLSTTTEDAVIHYTVDGSVPTGKSTAYTVPVSVTNTFGSAGGMVTIKAIAIKSGSKDSVVTAKSIQFSATTPSGETVVSGIRYGEYVVGRTTQIDVRYHADSNYSNGSVTFEMPATLTANENDSISLSSGSSIFGIPSSNYQPILIKDLGANAIISPDGKLVKVFNVMSEESSLFINLNLKDRTITAPGKFSFKATGDRDGDLTAFCPSTGTGKENYVFEPSYRNVVTVKVSLPDGKVAPVGGVGIYLNLDNEKSGCGYYGRISENKNSVECEMAVENGYYKLSCKPDSSVFSGGYYKFNSSFVSIQSADFLAIYNDFDNLNLVLEENPNQGSISVTTDHLANIIAGTEESIYLDYSGSENYNNGTVEFNLPEALTFSLNDSVSLCQDSLTLTPVSGSKIKPVTAGSLIYTIAGLDKNAVLSNNGHTLKILGIQPNEGVAFNLLVSLFPRIFSSAGDYLFSCVGDVDGSGLLKPTSGKGTEAIIVTVVEATKISGTINFPDQLIDLANSTVVELTFDGSEQYKKNVYIPKGQNSVDFSMSLVEGDYIVSAVALGYEDQRRYYNASGSVDDRSKATVVVLDQDKSDIDITLSMRTKAGQLNVTGEGETSGLEGNTSRFELIYTSPDLYTSGTLTFDLPDAFKVSGADLVEVSSGTSLVSVTNGVSLKYSSSGSSRFYKVSDLLANGVVGKDGSQLMLKGVKTYTGTLLKVTLLLFDKLMTTAGDMDFSVSGDKDGSGIVEPSSGTGTESGKFEVIGKINVSGKISLPDGMVAPVGGIGMHVTANGDSRHVVWVDILEGTNTADYVLGVLPGEYKVDVRSWNDLFTGGYYTPTKVVPTVELGENIDASSDVQNINMELVPVVK